MDSKVIKNKLFSDLTTLEIGGPIDLYTEVSSLTELNEALSYAKDNNLDFLILGGGSNLLVSDEGFKGLVIKNKIFGIEQSDQKLVVKSGTPLQELVDLSCHNNLAGLQKLTGIPGSVGGAIFGNAGAYGQTISDCLETVLVLDLKTLEEKTLTKNDCGFSYRDSLLKKLGVIIIAATFNLSPTKENLKKAAQEILEKRLNKYKPGIKCPGSFFKNVLMENLSEEQKKLIPPERDYYGKIPAWYFLDEVGAKGDKLGSIEIAAFHGNLFMNNGGGKADDFYNLAKKYHQKVKEKFGVSLEPEVQLINLPPF